MDQGVLNHVQQSFFQLVEALCASAILMLPAFDMHRLERGRMNHCTVLHPHKSHSVTAMSRPVAAWAFGYRRIWQTECLKDVVVTKDDWEGSPGPEG